MSARPRAALVLLALGGVSLPAQPTPQSAARPAGATAAPPLASAAARATIAAVPVTLRASSETIDDASLARGVVVAQVELAAPLDGAPAGAYDLVVRRTAVGFGAWLAARGRAVAPLRHFSVNTNPSRGSSGSSGLRVCAGGCKASMPDRSGLTLGATPIASRKQWYWDTVTVQATVTDRTGNPASSAGVQFALHSQLSGGTPPTDMVELLPSPPGTARLVIKKEPLFVSLQARTGNLFATAGVYGYAPPSSGSGGSSGSSCQATLDASATFCWW